MVEQYVNFYVIKGLIMHVKIFDHTFIIGNYKIIEYHNGKEISSFYSKVSLSPQDVKGKYHFCGHPGGLFGL